MLCSAMRCCPPKDVVIDALSAEPIRRRRVERGNTPTLNPPEREGGERERDGGRGGVWVGRSGAGHKLSMRRRA